MNVPAYSLLLCTNGAPEGRPALDYGVWLAGQLQLPVTLLGIVETPSEDAGVQQMLATVQAQLDAAGTAYASLVRTGRVRDVTGSDAIPGQHLTVIGPMGRPRWRHWLRGGSFRRMMLDLRTPFIYTRVAHRQLARILLCTGALDYAVSAESWALYLAQRMGATLTILHVAEAVQYHYPTAQQVRAHRRDFLAADIPQARHLRALLDQARTQGVEASVAVRHGTVVHEIIGEARSGGYDLVVMGSKHSSHSLRRQYLPDVAAGVIEAVNLPVLIVRADQVCILARPPAGGTGEG